MQIRKAFRAGPTTATLEAAGNRENDATVYVRVHVPTKGGEATRCSLQIVAAMLRFSICASLLLAATSAFHSPLARPAARPPVFVRAALAEPTAIPVESAERPMLSGLQGKALAASWADDVPTKAQVRAVVPNHCYKRDTRRSLSCLFQSATLTAFFSATGLLIPFKAAFLPVWVAYACVTGTVAMGLWVLAHECGHGAFSDNRFCKPRLETTSKLRPRFLGKHAGRRHLVIS